MGYVPPPPWALPDGTPNPAFDRWMERRIDRTRLYTAILLAVGVPFLIALLVLVVR